MATTTIPPLLPLPTILIQNNTDSEAKLLYQRLDIGEVPPHQLIEAHRTVEFKLFSNRVGYLAYQLVNRPKWIICWSLQPDDNKVFTQVIDEGQNQNTAINLDTNVVDYVVPYAKSN